jgi:hypothetical protein
MKDKNMKDHNKEIRNLTETVNNMYEFFVPPHDVGPGSWGPPSGGGGGGDAGGLYEWLLLYFQFMRLLGAYNDCVAAGENCSELWERLEEMECELYPDRCDNDDDDDDKIIPGDQKPDPIQPTQDPEGGPYQIYSEATYPPELEPDPDWSPGPSTIGPLFPEPYEDDDEKDPYYPIPKSPPEGPIIPDITLPNGEKIPPHWIIWSLLNQLSD